MLNKQNHPEPIMVTSLYISSTILVLVVFDIFQSVAFLIVLRLAT